MTKIDIRLSADRIKAVAGEKVRLTVAFDKPAFASVNERREIKGYENVIRTNEKVNGIDIEAVVHEDTTDFIIMTDVLGVPHLNEDQNAVAAWYHVTVVKDVPDPEADPEPTKDLGDFQYKVGLISDLHICEDNDNKTAETNDNWWDEDDFKEAMDIFKADNDVKFVASCGDSLECGSPKIATPNDDYKILFDLYNVPYWQIAGLRFFTPAGNHDFYGMFESRNGDNIMPERFTNYNSIDGHNQSVRDRIGAISVSGQGINGIVPSRGRIVFDLEAGKNTATGQADMNFLAYNSFVELYKAAAGFTDKLVPSENRYSDAAMNCMKNYVLNNWDSCKDDLSGWNAGNNGMRNGYSKLNYWLKKDDCLFIFLSVDYGDDVWEINNKWHDRMIHARTIINLDTDDPYIRRMKEFVADTGYCDADKAYNYQYYSVNSLIWLKEIIEHNTDKKIFVFTHHYMPNKVGNGAGIAKDGAWSYADISKAGVLTSDGMNKGSNCLTGIEFWFINKLNNLYKNVVWFSGHSHISWEVDCHVDNHDYDIVSPSTDSKYVYTKASNKAKSNAAWSVALPSLSKPRNIVGNESVRLYDDAEITIMEVYQKGVKLKGYKIRKDGKNVFDANNPIAEKVLSLL